MNQSNQAFFWLHVAIMVMWLVGFGLPQAFSQEQQMTKTLNDLKNLLNDYSVRDEIELVDTQLKKLKPIMQEMLTISSDLAREIADAETDEKKEALQKKENEILATLRSKVDKVLLPHQWLRLNQIHLQRSVKPSRNTTFGLLKMNEQLDLSQAQVSEIKKKAKENDARFYERIDEMRAEIRELRQKMQKEVVRELNKEQQKKYETLVGPEYLQPYWVTYWFTINKDKRKMLSNR